MKRVAVIALTSGVLLAGGAAPGSAAAPAWPAPQCGIVDSAGSLTYTWSEGSHLNSTTGTMRPYMRIDDLKVLATPGDLLAVDYAGALYASHNAGCTWSSVGAVQGSSPWAISPAPDGSAYVWTRLNDQRMYRVIDHQVTELPFAATQVGALAALSVDPADSTHLRGVTTSGVVVDSRDSGMTFQRHGTTPTPVRMSEVYAYDGAVAAGDLDHIVLGTMSDGAYVTMDGGYTWEPALLGGPRHNVNAFSVAISPADDNIVWAMALDITEMDAGAASQGRHIFRSVDGGRTFAPVVDHQPGVVTLTNGVLLVPNPADTDVVYFEFGTWFSGYGTDLYRYDAGQNKLSSTHDPYDDITAIAFNPAYPLAMYLGLAEEH